MDDGSGGEGPRKRKAEAEARKSPKPVLEVPNTSKRRQSPQAEVSWHLGWQTFQHGMHVASPFVRSLPALVCKKNASVRCLKTVHMVAPKWWTGLQSDAFAS